MKPPSPPDSEPLGAALTRWPGAAAVAIGIAAFVIASAHLPFLRVADLALVDAQFAFLARHAARPAQDGIVVVGVDEATLAATPLPLALTHPLLGRALGAIAEARPRAVGIDIILPDRSYDAQNPGGDQALVAGLVALRRVAPVVIGVSTSADGTPRRVHPPFVAAATASGLALLPVDADGRVRRFDERFGANDEAVPTLVGELARALGATPRRGMLDYALGEGFDYVPLAHVLALADAGDLARLVALFRDRIVLVGAVLPHDDRLRQPVPLARFEATHDIPGVLVHAQALRTQLAGAAVVFAPRPLGVALVFAAALLWWLRGVRRRTLAFALVVVAVLAAGTMSLRHGLELPTGAILRAALVAYLARGTLDFLRVRRDRARLRRLFGGYVSPAVLAEILAGRLDARGATRRTLAFLFADVRDFTTLSERTAPEDVLALLNRYFDAMAPAVHREGGTIDNFRGDGLMAVFGAPNTLARPANAAVAAALAMFAALATLNRGLVSEGRAPLAIGVTLALGDAVVGNVGARDRYNYTALGDAANVAARLQDVVKSSGFPLVATAALVAAADGAAAADWTPLGTIALRGHAPAEVCGADPTASP